MKRVKVLLFIILFALQAIGQSTLDIYKTGVLQLVPVEGYSEGVDWKVIFPDYNKVSQGNPIGRYKSMAVSPDGSVFVGNYSSYTIQKFDANGKLQFVFGNLGKNDEDFKKRPMLGGVVGGKYVFTYEHNGHIKLFTLDGKYSKTIVLDYMPTKAIALNSNKIAVVGHVPLGKGRVRYVITLIDPETEEKQIIRKFDDLWRGTGLVIRKNNYMLSFSPIYSQNTLVIRAHPNGNLIAGSTFSKQIDVYSPDGKLESSFNLDYDSLPYPEDLKKEFVSKIEEMVKAGKYTQEDIAPIYNEDFFQKQMPFYYNFLIDNDGNLLIFRYVDEDVDHKFRIYTYDGNWKAIGDVKLETKDYKLNLQYRFEEMAFHKDIIIGLVQPNNDKLEPVRLVKFEMKGK